jgi:hypothetical protein
MAGFDMKTTKPKVSTDVRKEISTKKTVAPSTVRSNPVVKSIKYITPIKSVSPSPKYYDGKMPVEPGYVVRTLRLGERVEYISRYPDLIGEIRAEWAYGYVIAFAQDNQSVFIE